MAQETKHHQQSASPVGSIWSFLLLFIMLLLLLIKLLLLLIMLLLLLIKLLLLLIMLLLLLIMLLLLLIKLLLLLIMMAWKFVLSTSRERVPSLQCWKIKFRKAAVNLLIIQQHLPGQNILHSDSVKLDFIFPQGTTFSLPAHDKFI